MRRVTFLFLLSLTASAGCAVGNATPGADAPEWSLARAAVKYSAAMRSDSDNELRQWSCGAYAVVYRNVTDRQLAKLRLAAAGRHGAFGGSTVIHADQRGTTGQVTLADSYLHDGVRSLGRRYTFIMSKDSGSWKVCDSEPAQSRWETAGGSSHTVHFAGK